MPSPQQRRIVHHQLRWMQKKAGSSSGAGGQRRQQRAPLLSCAPRIRPPPLVIFTRVQRTATSQSTPPFARARERGIMILYPPCSAAGCPLPSGGAKAFSARRDAAKRGEMMCTQNKLLCLCISHHGGRQAHPPTTMSMCCWPSVPLGWGHAATVSATNPSWCLPAGVLEVVGLHLVCGRCHGG